MILLSDERQCFSRSNTFGTTPTACIRFAILSRIETLHILLEHSYDSQRNERSSARRLHRRQPVARSEDLISPRRRLPVARRPAGLPTVLRAANHADLPYPAFDLGRPIRNEAVLAVERLCARV